MEDGVELRQPRFGRFGVPVLMPFSLRSIARIFAGVRGPFCEPPCPGRLPAIPHPP